MTCDDVRTELGRYLDEAASPSAHRMIEAHVAVCADCRAELAQLRSMTSALSVRPSAPVPEGLWTAVASRLDETAPGPGGRWRWPRRLRNVPWAVAATIALIVGVSIVGGDGSGSPASAAPIDYGVLLDALPLDAEKAFRKFVMRYHGRLVSPMDARRHAPELNFATPGALPGGFRLQGVYALRIGGQPGVAAAYARDDEFLAAIFHPPFCREHLGQRDHMKCVIGDQCGHKVEVGRWKLVHLTDPTTCHCVLSRLDESEELPAIMKAVAPDSPAGTLHSGPASGS